MDSVKKISTEIHKDFEKGPLRRSLFSNGAVSLFHKVEGRVGSKVCLYFLVGSQDENKDEYGITHLLEHMMFKEGGGQKIVRSLEMNGADINAYTYKEYVCFELTCLTRRLSEFLPLFLELFLSPSFTEEDFLLEREVVIQELREDLDDHENTGHEFLMDKLYPESLGHPIGGSEKSVRGINFKKLQAFHKKFFTPERLVISVSAGDNFSELEEILEQAFKKYLPLTNKKPYRIKPVKSNFSMKPFRKGLKKKLENPILFMGFEAPSLGSDYYYDLVVLDDILCQGLSSKLFIELREKEALVYGLASDFSSFLKYGHYVMTFYPPADKVSAVKKKVLDVLKEIAAEGLEKELVEHSKSRILDFWDYAFDDMSERNDFFAMQEIYNKKTFSLERQRKKLLNVSGKRIQQFLREQLANAYFELIIRGEHDRIKNKKTSTLR